jgi:hypothetical protein
LHRAGTVVATSAATGAYALLGCADDVAKMLRKNSRGVSMRAKLAVQAVVALSFCYWARTYALASASQFTCGLEKNAALKRLGWSFRPRVGLTRGLRLAEGLLFHRAHRWWSLKRLV